MMDDFCDTCLGQGFLPMVDSGDPCPDCEHGREQAEWEAYWDNLTPEEQRREQDMMSDYVSFHAELARREGRAS